MKLYIVKSNPNGYVRSISGVRNARSELGREALLVDARDTVRALDTTGRPQLVGEGDGEQMERACKRLEEAGCEYVFDLTDEQIDAWAEITTADEDDEDFTARTALVLMAVGGGNPTQALTIAKSLQINTGDPAFFTEVGELLEAAFPSNLD